jgi:hypothetical protein
VYDIDLSIKNWPQCDNTSLIKVEDILLVEQKLNTSLPNAYKYLLTTYGLLRTPSVLTKTCDLSVDIGVVIDFLSVNDVISLSELYVMAGMPSGYVLFASSSNGEMFCFNPNDCLTCQQDAAVWRYNQASFSVAKVADSLSEWLSKFTV